VLTTSKASAATAKVATAAAATGMVGTAAPTAIAVGGTGTAIVGKIAAVCVVVAAVAGGTTAVVRHTQHGNVVKPAPTTTVVVAATPPTANKRVSTQPLTPLPVIAPEATTIAPTATTTPVTPIESKPVRPDTPARAVPVPVATSTATATPAVTTSPLDDEIALVRDARSALRAGDAPHSLAILDEHDRLFPAGALSEDCAAERIYALCALGRVDEARALATRFLADHPVSPHAASVRASCGSAGGMN